MFKPIAWIKGQNIKNDGLTFPNAVNMPINHENDMNEVLEEKKPIPIVKGCFIATAAMGSDLHPHVQSLREFRDNVLLESRYKDTFEGLLEWYYRFSPPIAAAMKKKTYLRLLSRYLLVYPVVFAIKIVLPIFNVILGIRKDAESKAGRSKPKPQN